ncbi:MAG: ATP-binding cassette domain-containing protein [Spirochaetales bacterium]|nr:ATP-binding cassette domain-containing protein [Spirochaetales bacterium]
MIEVEKVCKSYGPVQAVKDVSFSIQKGEIMGLLGPNGAGKTTIMKALTCYHYPTSGRITLDGIDAVENPQEVRMRIGYLPESAPVYPELHVSEYLDFIARVRGLKGERKTQFLKEAVQECALERYLHHPVGILSKGYRQRVGLAQAILHKPDILILDEPTTGLDPNQILEIRGLIRNLGKEKTVILSTHILQEVEAVCDRVLILNDGSILAEGTTGEIERSMKGELVYSLLLKGEIGDGAKEDLENRPGVVKVNALEASDRGFRLECTMDQGEDPGEILFDWAVEKGYKILSMTPVRMSLEDIFTKLTKEGGAYVS